MLYNVQKYKLKIGLRKCLCKMRILLKNILTISFTIYGISGNTQYNGIDILQGKRKVEIPFNYVQGFIVIDIQYQFIIPLSLIFDTGAQNTIIFDKSTLDLINTEYSKEIDIMGADYSYEIKALIARNINLSLTEGKIGVDRDILVLKEDIVKLGEIVGKEIHGIIGANYFKGLIIEINYRKNKLTFHNPNFFNFKRVKEYSKVPIELIDSKPYIQATAYADSIQAKPIKFLLDTGASLSLMMLANAENGIKIPQNTIVGSLGKGLGGDIKGYVGFIDSFKISDDGTTINRPLSYFQKLNLSENDSLLVRDGMIGNTLLERFDIVIDYHNKNLYLKPNKTFKDEFIYDRSGINVIASGTNLNRFIISSILKNSPASEAGLLPNDEIIKIGWWPRFLLSLNRINNILAGKPGKKISITVRRNGIKIKRTITLKNLI